MSLLEKYPINVGDVITVKKFPGVWSSSDGAKDPTLAAYPIVGTVEYVDYDESYVYFRLSNGYGFAINDSYAQHFILNSTNKNNSMQTLQEKFKIAFKGEPEKSFIKAGVMNTDESLTSDGQALFLAWLLKTNGDAFKKDVIDPILAEDEKQK